MAKDKKLQTNQEVEKEQENGSPFSDFWYAFRMKILG